MPVVSAINLKGGVGKTSVCLHLAGALALIGRRILAVDNDPQSSLTAGFLGAQPTRQLDPGRHNRGGLRRRRSAARGGDPIQRLRPDRPVARLAVCRRGQHSPPT